VKLFLTSESFISKVVESGSTSEVGAMVARHVTISKGEILVFAKKAANVRCMLDFVQMRLLPSVFLSQKNFGPGSIKQLNGWLDWDLNH
jgi:hypothetical protein